MARVVTGHYGRSQNTPQRNGDGTPKPPLPRGGGPAKPVEG